MMNIPKFDLEHYRLNISLPSIPTIKKPTQLEVTWKKICAFFKKIWSYICFWKTDTKFRLTNAQVKVIKSLKQKHKDRNIEVLSPKPTELQVSDELNPYEPKDPTLVRFNEFSGNFFETLLLKCINEEKIKKAAPLWKESLLTIHSQVKSFVEGLLNFKKTAAPLFNSFVGLNDSVITIVTQQLLQIFLKPYEGIDNPEDEVEKDLIKKIKELKAAEEINDEQYESILTIIKPTLRWLFNSNQWLINSKRPNILNHFLVDALNFFTPFSTMLLQGDFDDYLKSIGECLDQSFEDDIQNLLQDNTQKVVQYLSSRLAELIENLPYQETFKKIVFSIIDQTEGWIEANDEKDKKQKLIANAKNDVKQKATTKEEVTKQQAARDILDNVKSAGGDSPYLESKFLEAFTRTDTCHPNTKETIQSNDDKSMDNVTDEIFDDFIELVIESLLPSSSITLPDGTEVKISGISQIIDHLLIPENAKEVLNKGQAIINRVLEVGTFKDKEKFSQYLQALIKILFVQFIHNSLKDILKEGLKDFIEQLSSNEYLEQLFAEQILPELIDVTFRSWVKTIINKNLSVVTPYLHKIIESKSSAELASNQLRDKIYYMMKKETTDFSLSEDEKLIIHEVIFEIVKNLLDALKKKSPGNQLSEREVHSAVVLYFQSDEVPSNNLYTKLIFQWLFKVSDFSLPYVKGSTETVTGWFKKAITEAVSSAMHSVDQSYYLIIESLVHTGNKNWLDPKKLKEIFFPKQLTQDAKKKKIEENTKNLNTQLTKISSLIHDLLYSEFSSWKMGTLIRNVTPSSRMIKSTLDDIFHSLLDRPILNRNLVLNVLRVAETAFKEAASNSQIKNEVTHFYSNFTEN